MPKRDPFLPRHKLPSERRLSRLRRTVIILAAVAILEAAALVYILAAYVLIPRPW